MYAHSQLAALLTGKNLFPIFLTVTSVSIIQYWYTLKELANIILKGVNIAHFYSSACNIKNNCPRKLCKRDISNNSMQIKFDVMFFGFVKFPYFLRQIRTMLSP